MPVLVLDLDEVIARLEVLLALARLLDVPDEVLAYLLLFELSFGFFLLLPDG